MYNHHKNARETSARRTQSLKIPRIISTVMSAINYTATHGNITGVIQIPWGILIKNKKNQLNLIASHNTYGKKKLLQMKYIRTPEEIWKDLSKEFNFTVDACASDKNHLLPRYWTEESDALKQEWKDEIIYCHPMYDSKIPKFVKKAMTSKCLTVFLLPSSTNSLYFHTHFWDGINHKPREHITIRFLPVIDRQYGYKMGTDDGELPDRGYLRPLMVVVVDRRESET
jgi:hypothetical protein